MPIYYRFTDRIGNIINLDGIDKEICEEFSIPYSSANYSFMFDIITMIGDYSNRTTGRFIMEDFDDAVKKCGYDDDTRWKILKYIQGKYQYSSWR
jgi:hypothetical protein